jgi:AcrR family transcriptional regulator
MKKPVSLSRDQLYAHVWSKPMSVLAREFGITGNALTKICNRVHVPYPSRGYWSKRAADQARLRIALPPAPTGMTEAITIALERAGSRRTHIRLSKAARREQLIDIAGRILTRDGAHAANMKRIAREAGISETQVYNYFRTREGLLVELAKRELNAISEGRRAELVRGHDHYSRLALSIRGYLRQVAERGVLLELLLRNPDVRLMLREDHRTRRDSDMSHHAGRLVEKFGVSRQVALYCTVILTSVSLRTGKLVANKKIAAEAAERLCVAITLQGSRDTIDKNYAGPAAV